MHQIQHHIFSVNCASTVFGKEVQNGIGDLMAKEFYPKLESLLNRYPLENHIWILERIEINLTTISKKNWKKELVSETLKEIETFLNSNFKALNTKVSNQPIVTSDMLLSEGHYAEIVLLNYIKNGFFNHNLKFKTVQDLEQQLLQQLFSGQDLKAHFGEDLMQLFYENPKSLVRFIYVISDQTKTLIQKDIFGFSFEIHSILKNVTFSESEFSSKNWLLFFEWNLHFFLIYTDSTRVVTQFNESAQVYFQFTPIQINDFFEAVQKLKVDGLSTQLVDLIQSFYQIFKANFSNKINTTTLNDETNNLNLVLDKNSKNLIVDEKKNQGHIKSNYKRFNLEAAPSTGFLDSSNETRELPTSIYIENSGLIILHPFLIPLFEELKLCTNEAWTSKRNQQKAVLLTQFLISGKTVFNENDLVLNKIVCGLEIDAVLDLNIQLTKNDLNEANGLLEAVIKYWKTLKNTSIDGLRETFLQRNGKLLFKKEGTIELRVEQKGVDVLMDQLPWGIGMVKTPWMKSFIECHWN